MIVFGATLVQDIKLGTVTMIKRFHWGQRNDSSHDYNQKVISNVQSDYLRTLQGVIQNLDSKYADLFNCTPNSSLEPDHGMYLHI